AGTVPASHSCTASDFTEGPTGNPVCIAAVDAAGFLTRGTFTSNPCGTEQACVTISVLGSSDLSWLAVPAPATRLASSPRSPCNKGKHAHTNGTLARGP